MYLWLLNREFGGFVLIYKWRTGMTWMLKIFTGKKKHRIFDIKRRTFFFVCHINKSDLFRPHLEGPCIGVGGVLGRPQPRFTTPDAGRTVFCMAKRTDDRITMPDPIPVSCLVCCHVIASCIIPRSVPGLHVSSKASKSTSLTNTSHWRIEQLLTSSSVYSTRQQFQRPSYVEYVTEDRLNLCFRRSFIDLNGIRREDCLDIVIHQTIPGTTSNCKPILIYKMGKIFFQLLKGFAQKEINSPIKRR